MKVRSIVKYFCLLSVTLSVLASGSRAAEYQKVDAGMYLKHKGVMDDPRPVYKELSYKKVLPPDVYAKLSWDVPTMQKAWKEVVGFAAPEVVGKIAP